MLERELAREKARGGSNNNDKKSSASNSTGKGLHSHITNSLNNNTIIL